MTYTEFRDRIRHTLSQHDAGLTWVELRDAADLPYRRPCPEWTKQLEVEIGLDRREKRGRALVWRLDPTLAGRQA